MEQPTRRSALRRGLLALGGLVGIGAAGAAGALAKPSPAASEPGSARTLTLFAHGLPGNGRGGHAARDGASTVTTRTDLLDGPDGRRVGEIHVATAPVLGRGISSPDAGAMEWHTFHLPDGTVIGSGSVGTERGAFAILGGTGAYANARGTYGLRRVAGGAEFVLRITG